MDPQSKEFSAYQRILEEHRALKDLLRTIDEALERRTATIAEVSDLLAKLGDQLIKHFALEEDGGYFAEALVHAPQLVAKANDLLAQHPKMCSGAKQVLTELQPGQNDEAWWLQTRQRFHAFRVELLKHERQEDKLLQEAYTQDIGAHD